MHPFFTSEDSRGNVIFHFTKRPSDALTAFGRGYHLAGHTLADRLSKANGYADYEGYPILFLYRHALELYLKAIVSRGADVLAFLEKDPPKTNCLLKRHDLAWLVPALRAIFKHMEWDFQGSGLTSFTEFENLIHTLDSVDPGSYAFRYPVTTTGAASLPKHFAINVVAFAARIDQVLDHLHGAATRIRENWDTAAEASSYELQQLLDKASEA